MTTSALTTECEPGDLIDFDALLTPEELELRNQVRAFVQAEIKPNIARWYEEAHFPLEIVPKMAKLGLLGMHLDGYGCGGSTATQYGLACRELEAVDSGLRGPLVCERYRAPGGGVGRAAPAGGDMRGLDASEPLRGRPCGAWPRAAPGGGAGRGLTGSLLMQVRGTTPC